MSIETMKLALEALENSVDLVELIGWLGRVLPFHKCKEKNGL
jgi:hypothetical protein